MEDIFEGSGFWFLLTVQDSNSPKRNRRIVWSFEVLGSVKVEGGGGLLRLFV